MVAAGSFIGRNHGFLSFNNLSYTKKEVWGNVLLIVLFVVAGGIIRYLDIGKFPVILLLIIAAYAGHVIFLFNHKNKKPSDAFYINLEFSVMFTVTLVAASGMFLRMMGRNHILFLVLCAILLQISGVGGLLILRKNIRKETYSKHIKTGANTALAGIVAAVGAATGIVFARGALKDLDQNFALIILFIINTLLAFLMMIGVSANFYKWFLQLMMIEGGDSD